MRWSVQRRLYNHQRQQDEGEGGGSEPDVRGGEKIMTFEQEKVLFRVWIIFWHVPMRTMPLVSGSLTKNFTQSRWLVPLKGSPPIPITVVCPRPTCNDIFHR